MSEAIVEHVRLASLPENEDAELFIGASGVIERFNAKRSDEQAQRAVVFEFAVTALLARTAAAARAIELLSLLVDEDADLLWEAAHRLRACIEVDKRASALREDELTRTFAEALLAVANPSTPLPVGAEMTTTLLVHDDRGRVVAKVVARK